jgi:two-component system, cell cycle response regulator
MRAGADDYIVKPFDKHELEVRLRAGRRILELQAQLISAQEALREQASRDSLTSLWNRRTIFDVLDTEIERAGRQHSGLGLLMIDIDHFKRVNDQYGHMVGDIVLQRTSERMRASMRKYDSVGRYGGEEFLVILPGCDDSSILAQADRVRKSIGDMPMTFTLAGKSKPTSLVVTASIGATLIPAGNGVNAQTAITAADEALYLAKRSGRNCSVLTRIVPSGELPHSAAAQGALL